MGKNLRDMTRQEQAAYFKSKDYCGEQLKVVMDAISYGISADYIQLFEDTTIPVETMENMFTAMKEDYGVEETAFLSTVSQEESGHILLEAMKSCVPLKELQGIYQDGMFPIELREKILPLMQGRKAIPEKIEERMEFITEAVRELKESFLRQSSFIEDLKKSMEEKADILSVQEKDTEAVTDANIRTAMEHKSDEREMEQGSRESGRAEKTTLTATEKTSSKDMTEKTGTAKDTAEKIRTTKKEIKQPVKGR